MPDKKYKSTDGKVWDAEMPTGSESHAARDKEKLQDTSPLVAAAAAAAAEKKKASPSPAPPLTGLAAAAEAERKRKAASQAKAVER